MIQQNLNSVMYEKLNELFGYDEFRPNQREIVESVVNGKDVFAVMPTGGGKSLCYQLPSSMMNGTCVVISPLISLMKDQVDGARENGMCAGHINSSMSMGHISDVYRSLHSGELNLLYVSPERFSMDSFIRTLQSVKISLFAIDEAHCISEWGHDFRPDYLSLSNIKTLFPGVPVSAFTASATNKVQSDIIQKLNLTDPLVIRASFDRPNLFYQVTPKNGFNKQLMNFLKKRKGDAGIIYRSTRKSVDETSSFLIESGIKALPYHAGLDKEVRQDHQDKFNRDEIQVIVATIAFGMGIDKSNVRFVVHGDLPKNMESYYQETGRAGRDGEPAFCQLFFGRGDIPKIRWFIDQIENDTEREVANRKLKNIVDFATFNVCRRRQVLGYFGEKLKEENCGGCDICLGEVETVNATRDAQIFMSAIARVRERFGVNHIIEIVTGANTEKIRKMGHQDIKTYGAGKDKPRPYWRSLADELINRECVFQTIDQFPVLKITKKGSDILFGKAEFSILQKKEKPAKSKAKKKRAVAAQYNDELFEELRKYRREIATAAKIPPYIVFSDKSLHDMCRIFPTNDEEMLSVNGVGQAKLKRFGRSFIKRIKLYLDRNPNLKNETTGFDEPVTEKQVTLSDKITKLVEQGVNFLEIASDLKISPQKVAKEIEKMIIKGEDIDVEDHIDTFTRISAERYFPSGKNIGIKSIVQKFDGEVSNAEARIIRGYIRKGNF